MVGVGVPVALHRSVASSLSLMWTSTGLVVIFGAAGKNKNKYRLLFITKFIFENKFWLCFVSII